MKLNLNTGPEKYVLFEGNGKGDDGIWFIARPALSAVLEEAKADQSLIEFGAEINALVSAAELDADGDPSEPVGIENTSLMLKLRGKTGVALAKSLFALVIDEWGGFEGADGKPAPIDRKHTDAALDVSAIYARFTEVYMQRWMEVELEKNGSAPSLTGNLAKAQNTAETALVSAQNVHSD